MKKVLAMVLCAVFLTGAVSAQSRLAKILERFKKPELPVIRYEITHNGLQRSYYVHEPKYWDKKKPVPAVFLFHGGGGNALQALKNYGMIDTSDFSNFLLIAPNGTGRLKESLLTWNVGCGFGYAEENNIDDCGFVNQLIKKLKTDYPVDEKRIYATGMSNGAFLCHWLAAQKNTPFAAIAPVVGSIGGAKIGSDVIITPPEPDRPVAACIINGELDEHVPLNGGLQKKSLGKARILSPVAESVLFWTKANGIEKSSEQYDDSILNASVTKYTGGKNGTSVVFYVLHNQGHAWPGSKEVPLPGSDTPSPNFNANQLIWEFFSRHIRN